MPRGAPQRSRTAVAAARPRAQAQQAPGGAWGLSFSLLFNANPVPLFLYDWDELSIIEVNDAALALYGYDRERFLTLAMPDLLAPDLVRQTLEERTTDPRPVRLGVRRHRKADGTIFPVDVSRQRIEVSGRITALAACIDASERVAAEDRLKRNQDILARAQRIAATGSVERNFQTRRTEWSDETYRLFGVARDSFVPSPAGLLTLVHPADRDRVAAELQCSQDGRPGPLLQYRITRPDGSERVIHREAEVLFDENGNPERSISILRDMTEAHEAAERQSTLESALRQAKERLEAANQELERRVEERTRQLAAAQEQLLRNERLLALGQLTGTVAHELRNPLSAIKNSVYAAKQLAAAAPGSPLERPLTRIERSIERCDSIISDLLDYSRVRELRPQRVALDRWLAEEAAEMAMPNGVVVALELTAPGVQASLDLERFRSVLINLLDNAAQAIQEAPAGAGRITLSTRRVAGAVELEIGDTGVGITPENLARVFEPLYSTKSFGTGLGLPTVKHIVEQHGGAIAIASEAGSGTRVTVTLPLAAAA